MSEKEQSLEFKDLYFPLTSKKAIGWITAVGFLVYFNALFGQFVWDDIVYIIANPEVHTINISKLFGINLFNSGAHYRPIPATYFAFLYSIFKDAQFFYHLSQLILHVANASLVYIFLKKFMKNVLAFLLAIIFLVHPIQVESVSYIAATISPLFFIFGMLALLISFEDEISHKRGALIFILLLFSILTKETGILFVLLIFIYRLLFKKTLLFSTIYGISSIILYFVIRFSAGVFFERAGTAQIANMSFSERLLSVPAATFYYIKTFFYPVYLAINQQWVVREANLTGFYIPLVLSILFIAAATFLIYLLRTNKKAFKLGIFLYLWFIMGLGMHLHIFPLDMTVADRWFYFPIVGIVGLIGLFLSKYKKFIRSEKVIIYILIGVVVVFSIRTMIRNNNWSTPLKLYANDSKIHTNADIENNLGAEYAKIKQYEEALLHFEKSAEFTPNEMNVLNIGLMHEQMGDIETAKDYYRKAMEQKNYQIIAPHKHNRQTYVMLANAILKTESPENAIKFINEALKDYEDSASLWTMLGIAEYQLGNQQAALDAIDRAREITPNNSLNILYLQIQNKEYEFEKSTL